MADGTRNGTEGTPVLVYAVTRLAVGWAPSDGDLGDFVSGGIVDAMEAYFLATHERTPAERRVVREMSVRFSSEMRRFFDGRSPDAIVTALRRDFGVGAFEAEHPEGDACRTAVDDALARSLG